MAQCSICSHEKAREINRRVLTGRRIKETAREFGINRGTLYSHMRNHLPWRSRRVKAAATAEEMLEELDFELRRLQVLGECGEKIGPAIQALVARRNLLELRMRSEGRLDSTHRKLIGARPLEGNYEVQFVNGRPRTVPVPAGAEKA